MKSNHEETKNRKDASGVGTLFTKADSFIVMQREAKMAKREKKAKRRLFAFFSLFAIFASSMHSLDGRLLCKSVLASEDEQKRPSCSSFLRGCFFEGE